MPQHLIYTLILSMGRRCATCLAVREIISPTKDQMFLAGHPSQGCFGLQSHCAPCYFFNQASFYPSDFSFSLATVLVFRAEWGVVGNTTTQRVTRLSFESFECKETFQHGSSILDLHQEGQGFIFVCRRCDTCTESITTPQ
ncbi:transposable element Tcb2 transposase [Trichonephila clavipes]|nr:transposable element Tcb2 transposase [Trichonephila clavipes]